MTEKKLIVDDLVEIGFQVIGRWAVGEGGGLSLQVAAGAEGAGVLNRRNALYAFVIGNEVVYIGKTARSLRSRLNGYRLPGSSQATNLRCNAYIRDASTRGVTVEVLVFTPISHLRYGNFEISLAAGLEDSMIAAFAPRWNGREGTRILTEEAEREIGDGAAADLPGASFSVTLGATYYNQGFINLDRRTSDQLGGHGETLEVLLGDTSEPHRLTIKRTANPNGAIRTNASPHLKRWFQSHFREGASVEGVIVSNNRIRLAGPSTPLAEGRPVEAIAAEVEDCGANQRRFETALSERFKLRDD